MDQLIVVAVILFLILALLSMAAGLVHWGRSQREPELEILKQEVERRDATILELERRREASAKGSLEDLRRAASIADAVGRGDLDGVLLSFPDADEELPSG